MLTIETLANFVGWMLLVNVIALTITASAILALRPWLTGIHARMMGVDAAALPALYFQYMANYKIAVIVFNLAPYIALRIMI